MHRYGIQNEAAMDANISRVGEFKPSLGQTGTVIDHAMTKI